MDHPKHCNLCGAPWKQLCDYCGRDSAPPMDRHPRVSGRSVILDVELARKLGLS